MRRVLPFILVALLSFILIGYRLVTAVMDTPTSVKAAQGE